MTDWITDRRPTVNDADRYGVVLVRGESPGFAPIWATWRYTAASDLPWRHTSNWSPGDPVAEESKEEAQSSTECNTATITLGPPQIESRYQWVLKRAKVLARAIGYNLEVGDALFVHDAVLELEELTHQLQEYANHD